MSTSKAGLECPYCHFEFKVLAVTGTLTPDLVAPIICENCGIVSLLEQGQIRKLTEPEYVEIQKSPSWEVIKVVQKLVNDRERETAANAATK